MVSFISTQIAIIKPVFLVYKRNVPISPYYVAGFGACTVCLDTRKTYSTNRKLSTAYHPYSKKKNNIYVMMLTGHTVLITDE